MELEFVELQTPLFLGGKNFGLKLSKEKFSGLDLFYDQENREVWVTFNTKAAIVPVSNVASMTPRQMVVVDGGKTEGPPPLAPVPPPGKIKAQVSTPTSHVFADGPGKTRDR